MMHKPSRFNTPELLDELRRCDRHVWEALYEEQWEPLCRFIQTRLHDHANRQIDSEDLAQEVLCRAYTSIGSFRGEASVGTWLRSIAHHVIVDAARTARLRQRFHNGSHHLEGAREQLYARSMPDPEMSALRKNVLGKILHELQAVLGAHSILFVRRHAEELSEEELAESEGMRRGTVSGYLSRARKRLRQQQARFMALR
jgi:RNA polymerase sigma-70 factor (ECF subfamily)